jgi:putative transposase
MPRYARIEGSETRLATEDQTSICGKLLQCQSAAQIPESFSDSLPRPHTTSCGHGSQVHSPIHLNPLRAAMVKSMGELDHYPWSGHTGLVGKRKNDWQEREYVLRQFHEKEGKAIRAYRRFMEEGKDQGRRPELVGGGSIRGLGGWSQVLPLGGSREMTNHDGRILGSEDFVTEIIREAEKKVRRYIRVSEMKTSMDNAIKEICRKEGVGEKELRMGVRTRKYSRVRAKISYFLSQEFGVSRAEIARQLGVCTSAIAKAIQNIEAEGNKC